MELILTCNYDDPRRRQALGFWYDDVALPSQCSIFFRIKCNDETLASKLEFQIRSKADPGMEINWARPIYGPYRHFWQLSLKYTGVLLDTILAVKQNYAAQEKNELVFFNKDQPLSLMINARSFSETIQRLSYAKVLTETEVTYYHEAFGIEKRRPFYFSVLPKAHINLVALMDTSSRVALF